MKKVLAFLVLIVHMNTSMLLPQIPEQDAYDANGKKLDDINSVVEYIQAALGNDTTADDEDDDNGQIFHIGKPVNFYFSQSGTIVEEKKSSESNSSHFAEYRSDKIKDASHDILTPPPEYPSF